MPRLAPVETPRGPFLRAAFWASRRQLGKVVGPLRVIYARKPRLAVIAGLIAHTMDRALSLDPALRLLVTTHTAQLNGCAFCADLSLAQAVQKRLGMDRFQALSEHATSPLFTAREKAALAFTEEATRHRTVSDATFERLRAHFSETEMVELTWLNAAENYFNLQAAVLGIESDALVEAALARAR